MLFQFIITMNLRHFFFPELLCLLSHTHTHTRFPSLGNIREHSFSEALPDLPPLPPLLPLFQVSQALPVSTPGLVRANQSLSPVRQRVSQQTLLLGKSLKGSGQDQVLLRAQMVNTDTHTNPHLHRFPCTVGLQPLSTIAQPMQQHSDQYLNEISARRVTVMMHSC